VRSILNYRNHDQRRRRRRQRPEPRRSLWLLLNDVLFTIRTGKTFQADVTRSIRVDVQHLHRRATSNIEPAEIKTPDFEGRSDG
jgi:hypothetical protein